MVDLLWAKDDLGVMLAIFELDHTTFSFQLLIQKTEIGYIHLLGYFENKDRKLLYILRLYLEHPLLFHYV